MAPLYVVTALSNPVRYRTRYALYLDFAARMAAAGIPLYTAELAFGDRPFVMTDPGNPRHVRVRGWDELWHKENLLNLAIQALPEDWEYVAWIDADVAFARPDWAWETVHQLQHYHVVQMFSHAQDVGPDFEPVGPVQTGFVYDWYHHPDKVRRGGYATFSHPGYAWAARREALDAVGGLFDTAILGSADRHMACALIGKAAHSYNAGVHPNYKEAVQEWERRAERFVRRDIGYVPGALTHYWHGRKSNRGYKDRWKILVDHQYDPYRHVYRDTQGLLALDTDAPLDLRDDLRRYFRSRHEDDIFTGEYRLRA